MIIATVTTCPQRWEHYQQLRRNFDALKAGIPLRTFQSTECAGSPLANNNVNARAALAYANRHLLDVPESWVLYLEDDVSLRRPLPALLPTLQSLGHLDSVDCWYLCNRKNPVIEQLRTDGMVLNRLAYPIEGSHSLLLPKRHLRRILDSHWGQAPDRAMFAAIHSVNWKVFQVVEPVLVEHVGEFSTYTISHKEPVE